MTIKTCIQGPHRNWPHMEPSQREECWRLHGEMPGSVSPPNSAFQSWMHLESPSELKNTDNSFPLSGILAKFYTWSVAQAILKLPEWCVQPGCIGRSFWVSCDTPCTRGDQESSDPCSSWCGSWKGYGFSCPPNTHNVSLQSYGSDGTNVTPGAMP